MSDDVIGSVATASANNTNISSLDPSLVVTEPTPNNFNLDINEDLTKIPFLKIEYIAGEIISALKVIYVSVVNGQAYVAKSNGTYPESLAIGIAVNSASPGSPVSVILLGVLQDASWAWAANELLFLSTTGSITNIPPSLPTDTYSVVVGKALTSNKIMVSVEPPITL